MALGVSDFTSNDVIDEISMGDPTADIVGYVVFTNNNLTSHKSCKFHKIVVSNGTGREVQVIAWNNLANKINSLQLGTIVLISSVKVNEIKNPAYNSGNVKFELLIKENSTVEAYDLYTPAIDNHIYDEIAISDAYTMINHSIKIQGIIRTEPRKHKNRDYECIIGSVTDGVHTLEVKFTCDCSSLDLLMGTSVQLQGEIEKLASGPPTLKVTDVNHIQVSENARVPFVEVLMGYYTH